MRWGCSQKLIGFSSRELTFLVPVPTSSASSLPEVHPLKSSIVGITVFAFWVVALATAKGLTKELMATCFTGE
jgi:hypothetical protein